MSKKDNRTTKEHFRIFQDEAQYWIERFGLKNWRIVFTHEKWDHEESSYANYGYNAEDRNVTINLEPDWQDEKVTEYQLRRSAFHEVVHVLLCRLRYLALCRTLGRLEIDEELHTVIRIMENAVWEPEQERKCQPQG